MGCGQDGHFFCFFMGKLPAKPLDWKKQLCFQKTWFFANSVEKSALEHFLPFEAILGSLGYIISNLR
jgi:hypothetical protein